ncbi:MAG TPA: HAMP domain-containing sensor histidine kinase, partial [Actinomycetota bacterium]|nr:HAMP domain-containing sensor histidine kinase [Actinomycetota bacterium]
MSLRARLLVAMVGLAAAGLLVADVATFRLLRQTLLERVDQQLLAATREAVHAFSAPPFGGPPRGEAGALFPAGTYAALLDAEGDPVKEQVFGFGQEAPPPPALPPGLPGQLGAGLPVRTFTTEAVGGGVRYRARAYAVRGGGALVVAIPLTDVVATLRRFVAIELVVTTGVLVALGLLASWLVRLGLRPLDRIAATASSIAAGDLSRRVEPAEDRTEVGRLGLALNAMLARIEEAFAERRASEERLRRFVADASHELRTPLTSVQGYAELFRRGAARDPEALATAMRRIEEESARMAQLVDELALLARLDQGRALEREPVDLAALARAATDAARVAHPDHPIEVLAGEPVVVEGDASRLRQVADNLISNACVHTPPGTPVRVRVEGVDGWAELSVEDEGPGVPPEHAPRIFERFYRVEPSRSRAHGGAGLGLAIVAAVARAHGGTVEHEPLPGGGARFRVRLPMEGPPPAA